MPWDYEAWTARIRGDPLGAGGLNRLRANNHSLVELLLREHLPSGLHNVLEVPRSVGCLVDSAGYSATGLQGASSYSANPATGEVTIALTAGYGWSLAALLAQLNVRDPDVANKPYVAQLKTPSSTTALTIGLRRLESALGAGNTWGAVNSDFDMALHTGPQPLSSLNIGAVRQWRHDQTLSNDVDSATQEGDWNTLVENSAILYAGANETHSTTGHDTQEVARQVVRVDYSGGYAIALDASGACSVASGATGIVTVTVPEFNAVSQMWSFGGVQDGSITVVNFLPATATTVNAYIYEYSGGVWARANKSFTLAVWGVPK